MIDPQVCVNTILANNPELAEPLLDLIVWIDEVKSTASDRALLDDLVDDVYVKTEHAQRGRETYKALRKSLAAND